MAILAQYNHTESTTDYGDFLKISSGSYTPARRVTAYDVGTTESGGLQFYDECLRGTFTANTSYFIHMRVLRQPNEDAGIQNFSIKLVNYDSTSSSKEQYIKDITITQQGYTSYTPVKYGDTIDLANNQYYIKKTVDGKVTFTLIEGTEWYVKDSSGNFVSIGSKFSYSDESKDKPMNYYSISDNTIDLSEGTWSGDAPESTYSWIKGNKTIDIDKDSIDIKDFTLLNDHSGEADYTSPICLVSEEPAWGDVYFTFTPLQTFDCLLFTLQRTAADYRGETRYPLMIYQELSEVQNILTGNNGKPPSNLIKIGVLSHPALKMFINKEEIHIGNTGMYEIRSGKLNINTFSILEEAVDTDIETIESNAYNTWSTSKTGSSNTDTKSVSIATRVIGSDGRTRTIDGFTIDYMV